MGRHVLTECGGCGGLWLAAPVFEELCSAAERAGIASGVAAARSAPVVSERVVYRPCPACHELMTRRNHGGSSGVVVDVCRGHGIWLDHRELEQVLAWVRAGGPERERQRRVERARRAEPAEARPPSLPLEPPSAEPSFDILEALSWLLKRAG